MEGIFALSGRIVQDKFVRGNLKNYCHSRLRGNDMCLVEKLRFRGNVNLDHRIHIAVQLDLDFIFTHLTQHAHR